MMRQAFLIVGLMLLVPLGSAGAAQQVSNEGSPSEQSADGADDDVIIIEESGGAEESEDVVIIEESDEAAQSDDVIIVLDEPSESNSAPMLPVFSARTWLKREYTSRLSMDTVFDGTEEDVIELWNLGRLTLDHRTESRLRAVVEGWVRWGVTAEHADPGDVFWVLNAGDPKWTGEVSLREAYLAWSTGPWQFELGQKIFVWGKNEILAAADALNPADLRFDPVGSLNSTRDGKVPVFAFDVTWWHGDSSVELVVLPFFTASRSFVTGRDFALAPPGSQLDSNFRQVATIHPSVEDEIQAGLVGSEVPEESPLNATLALRLTSSVWGWDLAMTALYGWQQTPDVWIDSDLQTLLFSGQLNVQNPQGAVTNPVGNAAALAVQQKGASGQELFRASYDRRILLALEAQGVVGPFIARLDLGFSPSAIAYTQNLEAVSLPTTTASGGLEYTYGDSWYVQVTGFGIAALNPPLTPLMGLEKALAEGEDPVERDVAARYGVSSAVKWTWVDSQVEWSLGGVVNIKPQDFVVTAQVSYADFEPHVFRLGAVLIDGPTGTIGRNFGNNDFAYFEYGLSW